MSGQRLVVLDASALLAWLLHERGAQTVDRMLSAGVAPVSVVVETLYRAVEKGHKLPPDQLYEALVEMGLDVDAIAPEDAVRAAELIAASRTSPAAGSLSLGDGLCIAVAERLGLPITGGDQHWGTLDLQVPYLPFR